MCEYNVLIFVITTNQKRSLLGIAVSTSHIPLEGVEVPCTSTVCLVLSQTVDHRPTGWRSWSRSLSNLSSWPSYRSVFFGSLTSLGGLTSSCILYNRGETFWVWSSDVWGGCCAFEKSFLELCAEFSFASFIELTMDLSHHGSSIYSMEAITGPMVLFPEFISTVLQGKTHTKVIAFQATIKSPCLSSLFWGWLVSQHQHQHNHYPRISGQIQRTCKTMIPAWV